MRVCAFHRRCQVPLRKLCPTCELDPCNHGGHLSSVLDPDPRCMGRGVQRERGGGGGFSQFLGHFGILCIIMSILNVHQRGKIFLYPSSKNEK